MAITYGEAHQDWSKVVAIVNKAMNDGSVPPAHFTTATESRRAAEAEITEIENAQLEQSNRKYKALSHELNARKADLEKAANDAQQFIAAAGQADQLIQILTRLLPFVV